ncbi:MAG: hypothetical protein QM737_15390 [Ferruginibacter sp.]
MLTRHNYQNSTEAQSINQPNNNVFICCKKDDAPDDPKCTDCCYDTWNDELKEVKQKYTKADELAIQAKKKADFAVDKNLRFKSWLEEFKNAEEIARKICYQLEFIAGQTEKIWYNSLKAVDAIEILYCMIKDFYIQVDCLKTRYDVLQNCINVNTDPSLEKDKGILKCLADYYKKLDDIIKTRDEIIKAIVAAIHISNIIRNNMSTQDCPKDYNPCDKNHKPCNCNCAPEHIYYGFKTIICEWYCAFECDEKCVPCEELNEQQRRRHGNEEGPYKLNLCSDHCDLKPIFEFPICNNTYKCELEKCFKKSEEEVKCTAKNLNDANKDRDALAACQASLQKAIDEVDPKTRCK